MSTTVVLPKPERKMDLLEQIKKLDEQRAKLIGDAKTAALKKVNEGIVDLAELGFTYTVSEGSAPTPKEAKTGIKRKRDPNKPCGICKFVTEPPHDGRAHKNRSQKAFTEKELDALGLKKA